MLESNGRQSNQAEELQSSSVLQFLLFIDERPTSQESTRALQEYLGDLQSEFPFQLEVIRVGQRPDLVEYFRLMATPSLVKIHPEPRHVLAGSDLIEQLGRWWKRWKQEGLEAQGEEVESPDVPGSSVGCSLEQIRLTDEIFRLKRENEELLDQLQFKDQVIAMLAHDLRSPLTAAAIAVETLELAQNQPDSERSAYLSAQLYRQARSQFRIMNRMITDILQAAKGHSGELNLQLQALSLPPLCEEVLTQLADRFEARSLHLTKDLPQDFPSVYADEELIRQVLTNLLENAIKYTPAGGRINLSLLHRTSQKVQVSVSDTGPGIPQEKRERIFEGHFRLKRDRETEGYGIGLSLCQNIVRAHYGQIWVDSVLNEGSCFHFTLPVYR
ncbi:histidine kinase [Spirulina subsalsa FACHB-351]|uniref:Adaptive-response sensory-kinase SasA n=1 Tax=Spirulina subsalsa FACHB-351 TaxID=234711 RepID=A0ABT3LBC0_9CYAN|nr:histidine kinase [Spirulina subsalsa]MCW6038809.1 histidine kinase [Spirulina subsalsa FACHB-351]